MGKKGTKRKTQWRILSITECPPQHLKSALSKQFSTDKNNVNITSTTETNNNEGALSQDDDCSNHESSYSNPTYLKRKSSTSSNYRNDYRNNSRYNYNSKQNSTSSTSSLHSSSRYTTYRRRPFSSLQNGTSRYSYYGAERTTSRGHRLTQSSASLHRDATDSTKKLHFNEDDYTRISTPRQDVIFKKGCFSQPKKYVSSTDTNTTSSAAASIVSAEESVSALSLPSLSPEQCSSIADSLDPEQGFVYSFIDQNGVVYSMVPNSFDQYNGQMMMLPYGYPPYLCSPDVTSPTDLNEEIEETRKSVESQESIQQIPSSDFDEKKVIDEVPMDASTSMATSEETLKMQENDDNKEGENDVSDEATVAADESTTEVTENTDETKENDDTVQNIPGQFYSYGYPPYYPTPVLYPYMIPQQFVPLYGNEFDINVEEDFNQDLDDQNRKPYRCRKKRRNTDGNSTGVSATTTDYSEDETEDEEGSECHEGFRDLADQNDRTDARGLQSQSNETDNKITLNVDVEEFVPRGIMKSTLNVNVQEFQPRNHKDSISSSNANENSIKHDRSNSSVHITAPAKIESSPVESVVKVADKKRTELTLAEKIKMRLAEEANIVPNQKIDKVQPPLPQRKNAKRELKSQAKNLGGRKKADQRKKESLNSFEIRKSSESKTPVSQSSQLSYAQIATTGVKETDKPPRKEEPVLSAQKSDEISEKPSKKESVECALKPTSSSCKTKVNISENEQSESWHTVKSKGKRGKQVKGRFRDETIRDEMMQSVEAIETPKPVAQEKQKPLQPEVECVILPEINTEAPKVEPEPTLTTPPAPKKSQKPKQRKNTKKTPDSSAKKKKKIELIEPIFELPKIEKTILKKTVQPILENTVSVPIEDDLVDEADIKDISDFEGGEAEEIPFSSRKSNFSFDKLYLGKGFARDPLDILKGFDYKFKPKSILKEEEEMVLSVIKSLNNSTSSSPPKVSPTTSVIDDEDSDEKTIEDTIKYDAQDSGSDTDTVSELSIIGIEECKETIESAEERKETKCEQNMEEISVCQCEKDCSAASENTLQENSSTETCQIDATELSENLDVARDQIDQYNETNKDEPYSFDKLEDYYLNQEEVLIPYGAPTCIEESKQIETVDIGSQQKGAAIIENGIHLEYTVDLSDSPIKSGLGIFVNGQKDNTKISVDNDYSTVLVEKQNNEKLPNGDMFLPNLQKHLTNDVCNFSDGFLENDNSDFKIESNKENLKESSVNTTDEESIAIEVQPACQIDSSSPQLIQKVTLQSNGSDEGIIALNPENSSNGVTDSLDALLLSEDGIENGFKNELENGYYLAGKPEADQIDDFEAESRTELKKSTLSGLTSNGLNHAIRSTKKILCDVKEDVEITKSLTQSPFELKERLFEDLNFPVPKIEPNLLNASHDFVACVNALNTIIQSRECSLEPSRSRDNSLEPSQRSKGSIELNSSQDFPVNESIDNVISVHSDTLFGETEDFRACVDSLQNLINSRECSVDLQPVLETQICEKELCVENASPKDVISRESEQTILSAKPFTKEEFDNSQAQEKQNNENDQSVIPNEFNKPHETCDPLTLNSDPDLNYDLIEKQSSRTFKTSISCDHSSGIGSDCEDNQPASPGQTDQTVAQGGADIPFKPLFPVNDSSSINANSPKIAVMPENVLPILSETNSASCDNQSVSYTSSKDSFKANVNPSLNSSLRSPNEADDDPYLGLSKSSKFPHQEESGENRFPLTAAVKQWLMQESKESTPEPILRVPDDPSLKSLLGRKIQSISYVEEKDWSCTDESGDETLDDDDNEYEEVEAEYLQKHKTTPKNLKSNPLHVSSCNALTIDTDSDYNSDSNEHHCTERIGDNSCKRVAKNISDKTENATDKNDLLEFWDDEFVCDPRKWLTRSETALGSNSNSSTTTLPNREKRSPSTDPEPYVSVYGQTIDYKKLQANKYESLSNNILSVNSTSKNVGESKSSSNYQAATEQTKQNEKPLGSNNNFYNDNYTNKLNAARKVNATPTATAIRNPTHTNTENCLKPPEVCCILM